MKKLNAKKIVILVVLLFIVLLAIRTLLTKQEVTFTSSIPKEDTYTIVTTNFSNTISSTGVIESQHVYEIYSPQNLTIDEVFVSIGDVVSEDTLLLQYDDTSIRENIETKELNLTASLASAEQQVKSAQDTLDAAIFALDNGLNTSVSSAKNQFEIATNNMVNANAAYDTAKQQYESVEASQTSLITTAQADMEEKKATLDAALEEDRSTAQAAYDAAKSVYDTAVENKTATLSQLEDSLSSLQQASTSAQLSYISAMDSYNAATVSADAQLVTYENNLETAKLALNQDASLLEIERLYNDLEDTKLYASVSGVVTAVNATEGLTGNGLLFVVEDLEALQVTTSIQAYDIHNIDLGMETIIESNAIEDKSYKGTVTKVNKLVENNDQITTSTSSDATYSVELTVDDSDASLLIGMSVTTSFVLANKEQVFTVPHDAIYENEAGESCILLLTEQSSENGNITTLLVSESIVTTDLENDFEVIVTGADLMDGTIILNYADEYLDLIGTEVVYASDSNSSSFGLSRGM